MPSPLKLVRPREARRKPRVTPDPLLIISLPSGNSGIVLDVSEDGVGFLASSPVSEAASFRFEISGRAERGPEGIGELIWIDSSRKRGGLRFAEVPKELRELIAQFLPLNVGGLKRSESTPQLRLPLMAVMPTESRLEMEAETERRILGSDDIPNLPEFERKAPAVYQTPSRSWKFIANAFTLGLACVLALTVWYMVTDSGGRREALNLFSRIRVPVATFASFQINRLQQGWKAQSPQGRSASSGTSAGKPSAQPQSVGSYLPVKATPPVTDSSSTAKIETISAPGERDPHTMATARAEASTTLPSPTEVAALPQPLQAGGTSQDLDSPHSHDPGQAQLTLARTLLEKNDEVSDPRKAVALLWQAVEKGNSVAEIDLASLYLSGRGVSRSCNQALVLLTAAQSHKNSLAEQKLHDLHQYGCGPTDSQPTAAASDVSEPAE